MITIFACPRAFKGDFAIIQRNAIISWTLLHPKPEIILFGEEEGTLEVCREFNLRHMPEVARNQFGTPLVSDLFEKAQKLAKYDLVCYVNADIILTQSLMDAIAIVAQRWRSFFISCTPWCVAVDKELNFNFPDWQENLRALAQENGKTPDLDIGVDLFLFPRGFYRHIPHFSIGRLYWDHWLIFKASSRKIPFIDATQFVLTVHPKHEHSAHDNGTLLNEECFMNKRLAGWWPRTFAKADIPYLLERDGCLHKKPALELLKRRILALKFLPIFSKLRLRQRTGSFLKRLFLLLMRGFVFFKPHRFIIRFCFSSFFKSLNIFPEGSVANVLSGYGKNLKMTLNIGDKANPQETHYWLGYHELDIQHLFSRVIKKGFIVYDVGSNIGFYSLLAGRLVGSSGKIYAFDPFPKNIERVKHNSLLNGMQERIFCIPKAVADKTGQAIYHRSGRDDWVGFVNAEPGAEGHLTQGDFIAETISLDEFIFEKGYPAPDLIKIDVEAGEGRALRGAKRLLKEFKPLIICELHSLESALEVRQELMCLEYSIKDLNTKVKGGGMPHIVARPGSKA